MSEIQIINNIKPVELFNNSDNVDSLISAIESLINDHVPDTSTDKGRKEIASLAYKVSQTKSKLEKLGKDLVADEKEKIKKVDSERIRLTKHLDELRNKARQPLTLWEEEQDRIKREIEQFKVELNSLKPILEDDINSLKSKLEKLENFNFSIFENGGEFEKSIAESNKNALISRKSELELIEKQKIELAKLESEKKAEQERQAKIKAEQEAKELAEKEAKEKIRLAKLEEDRKLEQEKLKTQSIINKIAEIRPRKESILLKAQIEELENYEFQGVEILRESFIDTKLSKIKTLKYELGKAIEFEKREAELIAKEAEAKKQAEIEQAKKQAIEDERKKQEAIEIEKAKKAQNLAYRKKINNESLSDIESFCNEEKLTISIEAMKGIITAIATNQIRNITINY
jgi:hypothetical protein